MEPNPRLLTYEEFLATFGPEMRDITGTEHLVSPEGVIQLEPYLRVVPPGELFGHSVPEFKVHRVARGSDGRFDHVLIGTATPNVFLVIVVAVAAATVYGHHLLDLNELYGVKAHSEAS